jgi:proliferating cell nuclear antigen
LFHATLDSSKTWKQIVDALATLLTEAVFTIDEKGLTLRQFDPAKAAMVDLKLPAGVFQEYSCEGEHEVCLGVDELTKVSKRMAGDDKLEFNLDKTDQRFEIRMLGAAERRFKLQLLTPPDSKGKKPNLKFDVKAEMFADAFKQAVKDIGVVSIHVKMKAGGDMLTFAGEGDTGEAEVSLKVGDDSSLFDLAVKSDSQAIYALNYLSDITKAMSSDSITLQFSSDQPMMLEFAIAEAGTINFILAPRVERR